MGKYKYKKIVVEYSPHTNKPLLTIRGGKIVVVKPLKRESS